MMKKLLFCLLTLVGTGALSSCQQDEVANEVMASKGITICASLPGDDAQSRVILGDTEGATTKVYWEEGDKITLTIGSETYTFGISNYTENQTSAEFTCTSADALETLAAGTYTFCYGSKSVAVEQAGTKDGLSEYHYMTATFTATGETAWSDVDLQFTTQVAIVEISLGSLTGVTGVWLYDAADDDLLATATGTFIDKVYFAVPASTYTGQVMAEANNKFYEATVGENKLEVGNLYRIRKELTEFSSSSSTDGVECRVIGDAVIVYGTGEMTTEFEDNKEITRAIIMEGVTVIGNFAFYGCTGLTSVEIPESVTSIETQAFTYCTGLTSVEIPAGVTIGDQAFVGCTGLTSVEIPAGVTIGEYAFSDCTGLTSVEIPTGVTNIGVGTFAGCTALTSVEIPVGVTSIGENTFGCTGLTSVKIPAGVTSIGRDAFWNCTALASVEIPESVTNIEDNAFFMCDSLTSVTCRAVNPPSLGSEVFSDVYDLMKIYVPSGSVNAYKTATGWSDYADKIVAIQ